MPAPFPQDAYKIVTPRLIIRSAEPEDAEGLCTLFKTPENWPYGGAQTDLTVDAMRARIAAWKPKTVSGRNAMMIVALRETGEIIGDGGYNCFEDAHGNPIGLPGTDDDDGPPARPHLTDTGLILDHRHWGKGYGRETLCAKVDYAVEELACGVVRVETDLDNAPWRSLMTSLGLDRVETKGPTSYDANITGWIWNIDADTWRSVRGDLEKRGKWPL